MLSTPLSILTPRFGLHTPRKDQWTKAGIFLWPFVNEPSRFRVQQIGTEASSACITHTPQRPGCWKCRWRRMLWVHLWGVCTPGHLLSRSRRWNMASSQAVYWSGLPSLVVCAVSFALRNYIDTFPEGSSGLDTFEKDSRWPAFFSSLPSFHACPLTSMVPFS